MLSSIAQCFGIVRAALVARVVRVLALCAVAHEEAIAGLAGDSRKHDSGQYARFVVIRP
jgi:hypothetical protein